MSRSRPNWKTVLAESAAAQARFAEQLQQQEQIAASKQRQDGQAEKDSQISQLQSENVALKSEVEEMRTALAEAAAAIRQIRSQQQFEDLQLEKDSLQDDINELQSENAALKEQLTTSGQQSNDASYDAKMTLSRTIAIRKCCSQY